MLKNNFLKLSIIFTIIFLTSSTATQISAKNRYEIINLGSFADGSYARAINNLSQVVGSSSIPGTDPFAHAFLWEDGHMKDLGTLGGDSSLAYDINELGQIVGKAWTPEDAEHAFLISPEDTNQDGIPDRWYRDENQDGANDLMTDLGTMGGAESWAFALNDSGQITGWSYPSTGLRRAFVITPEDTNEDNIPDLWYRDDNEDGANDLMVKIGTLNEASYSDGYDINELGHVVGRSWGRAFIWKNDEMTELPKPWWFFALGSTALGINDFDQVAGNGTEDEYGSPALLWEEDFSTTELGILEGGCSSYAYAVNHSGQVVGYSTTDCYGGSPRGFLWENGVLYELTDLVSPPPYRLFVRYAEDINDAGEIAGSLYLLDSNKEYACLLRVKPTQFEDYANILNESVDFEDGPQIADKKKSKQLE